MSVMDESWTCDSVTLIGRVVGSTHSDDCWYHYQLDDIAEARRVPVHRPTELPWERDEPIFRSRDKP